MFCDFENEPLSCRQKRLPLQSKAARPLTLARSTGVLQLRECTDDATQLRLKPPSWSAVVSIGYEPVLPEVKWYNSKPTICYLATQLKAFPTTFARERSTPFIHHDLYSQHSPQHILEAYRVCESCSCDAEQTEDARLLVLKLKLQELAIVHQRICSFDDVLASVQALMLYMIICLFNDDPSIRHFGEQHRHLLHQWTRQQWLTAPSQAPSSLTPWQAWVLAESACRTILISHMIRGVYDSLKQGYHTHTLFLEALPFDPQTSLWEARSAEDWENGGPSRRPQMVSYREYVTHYTGGAETPNGLFEKLLLVACCGKENVESSSTSYEGLAVGNEQSPIP